MSFMSREIFLQIRRIEKNRTMTAIVSIFGTGGEDDAVSVWINIVYLGSWKCFWMYHHSSLLSLTRFVSVMKALKAGGLDSTLASAKRSAMCFTEENTVTNVCGIPSIWGFCLIFYHFHDRKKFRQGYAFNLF